jgi:hypothetical protein
MQRFCVTRISQRGRYYYVVNYPAEHKAWSRKAAGRAQKKFAKRELAEAFLAEAKREWKRKGGVKLGYDSAAHYDFMRAMEVIESIPNATLEKTALVFRMCVSLREKRGGKYEVSADRKIELSPRIYMVCEWEARRRGVSLVEAAEGVISGWLISEAGRQIRERSVAEAQELEELKKRNAIARQTLAETEKEDEIREVFGQGKLSFEQGRNSILMKRAAYQREWRRKRKEAVNGSRDCERLRAEEQKEAACS